MALTVAMHNWMRPEPIEVTIKRLGRSGYDGIEISGEPALYDTKQVRSLLDENGLECWGAVTLMVGGRDLLHEDKYVRVGSVQYVKDTIDMIKELGGKILTVVPSTVGKVTPMGSPEDEWQWAVESLKAFGSRSSRSTASRRTSSTVATKRSRSPRTSEVTAASAWTSST